MVISFTIKLSFHDHPIFKSSNHQIFKSISPCLLLHLGLKYQPHRQPNAPRTQVRLIVVVVIGVVV